MSSSSDYESQDKFLVGHPDYNNCSKGYEGSEEYFNGSDVTINPWQGNTVGYDTNYADQANKEYIVNSSPLLYALIVKRGTTFGSIDLGTFSEGGYLKEKTKVDAVYEEGEKELVPGEFRVYGAFEVPDWAQELGKFGMTENNEVTMSFNVGHLMSSLSGSVLQMGDIIKAFDTIRGWKYYEIMNALPTGNFLGQYLMWQTTAKMTDLEGYTRLEKSDLKHFDEHAPPTTTDDPELPPPSSKPRPKVY